MQKVDASKKKKHVRLLCYFFLYNSVIAMEQIDSGIKHNGNKDFNTRTLREDAELVATYQRQPIVDVVAQAKPTKGSKKRKPEIGIVIKEQLPKKPITRSSVEPSQKKDKQLVSINPRIEEKAEAQEEQQDEEEHPLVNRLSGSCSLSLPQITVNGVVSMGITIVFVEVKILKGYSSEEGVLVSQSELIPLTKPV